MIMRDNFITILNSSSCNINNKYNNYINSLSENINNIPNLILYGPAGVGKYKESLKIIQKFSDSKLKYEKKLLVSSVKNEHIIKISDIHYEINMENLTCNCKILFNDIYNNIVDVINSSKKKYGIILFKNFHNINNEILDNLYSYMQNDIYKKCMIKYIILSEYISFIPKSILDICKILYYSKLSYSNYIKLSNSTNKKFLTEQLKKDSSNENNPFIYTIDNINVLKYKNLYTNSININKSICDNLINIITIKTNIIDYTKIRNILYDMLIYNLNIYDCITYILSNVIMKINLSDITFFDNIFMETCNFFKYYNNNYRPIYHLEKYILFLIKEINKIDYDNTDENK